MKKSALTFLSICLLFGLAGCGDKNGSTTNPPESDTSKQTDSTGTKEGDSQTLDISTLDYSSPSIVIEFGEVEALVDLASKAQSFAVEEGTIAKITGLYSKGGSHPSIDQDAGDGKYEGLVMFVEGDYDEPEDKTKVEVTGVFLKGQYYMEFHVPAENIKVVE